MPFETKIENNAVFARYFGTVTFDDVRNSSAVSWGDPVWDTIEYYITDFLDADRLDMTPDQAVALAYMDNASLSRRRKQTKRAFVVANPQIVELVQIFLDKLEPSNWQVRLFDNMDAARDWLTAIDEHPATRIGADSLLLPDILTLVRQAFSPMEARINPPSSMNRMSVSSIQEDCVSGEVWAIGDPPLACVFLKQREDRLYISKLAVSREMRGKGCARRLIELAESRAAAKGLSSLELETRVELTENHGIFGKLGFSKTGEGTHAGFDRPTFIIMSKRL